MESAIPRPLQEERKIPVSTPAAYTPPFPAWTTRFSPLVEQVVMAYFGVQSTQTLGQLALVEITSRFSAAHGPSHWDLATYCDELGFVNDIVIAYWTSPESFSLWKTESQFDEWWHSADREQEDHGFFMEVVTPDIRGIETIFSNQYHPEGIAHLAQKMSDEMQEHGYWGSARDRLPIAQASRLEGQGGIRASSPLPARRIVQGSDNLCLIRSGQDWSDTLNEERSLYLEEVEPILNAGMRFLRDEGHTIGCLSCRYMHVLQRDDRLSLQKTFGLAHFTDLQALERWAKSHPTHVAIFDGFMRYVKALNFDIKLRLWHEISVIPAKSQYFEYINCHPHTGLLKKGE
ncbi:phenylacetaldoxime dehydratase family protein [Rosenbergiella nectarea]|uniref:phenylacetaldoxime dehydratase family protein n=1 Tax=Rosenbergiella nectarea TaxID=988801 RepID=UPI001BDB4D96|nr:phenylacetaldoxime dehydratase family protein [Rosenbergiella nectarea]MBT0729495.1 phenylacetaldoxime dehydratase family protein [Rosenbergiella nectarea subsp. apis]